MILLLMSRKQEKVKVCNVNVKFVIKISQTLGIFLTWTAIAGHNYFHMRDNFRMYYFDLCMMSSKEWRITHVMSHHMYTNTLWDYEMYVVEPLLHWIPHKNKTFIIGLIRTAISPIIWTFLYFYQAIKR